LPTLEPDKDSVEVLTLADRRRKTVTHGGTSAHYLATGNGFGHSNGTFTSADIKSEYHARYFMINGRAFPDTIAPNNAPWLPNQPYGALARVEPYDATTNPTPALLRYVSVAPKTVPFHPHSNHERVIGQDARFLGDGAVDLSSEKFAVVVNPSQTQDATFIWTNEWYTDPLSTTPVAAVGCTVTPTNSCGVAVQPPSHADVKEGDFWSGSPYLGSQEPFNNPSVNTKVACGEYYHVAHNHDLTQATNYGLTFGGMLTLIRVDPPGGHLNPACD